MKRQYWAKTLSALVALVLLSSCATKGDTHIPFYEGYALEGMEAAAYYEELLQKEESPLLRYNYVYSLYEGEDKESALEEALAGSRLYPEYLRFLFIAVQSAKDLGKEDILPELYLSILELDPINQTAVDGILNHYMEAGLMEEARNMAEKLVNKVTDQKMCILALSYSSEFYRELYQEKYSTV